jgi:hypothetical protein
MKKYLTLAVLAVSTVAFTSFANANTKTVAEPTVTAQTEAPTAMTSGKQINGFYIGGGLGTFGAISSSEFDDDLDEVNEDNNYEDLFDETHKATLKIYTGYHFNRIIGIEATYTDYGNITGTYLGNDVKQSPRSFSVAANAGYTFQNGLRPFALLGLSAISLNSNYDYLDTDNPLGIKFGTGLDYAPEALNGLIFRVAYECEMFFETSDFETTEGNYDDVYAFGLGSFYLGTSYNF